MRNYVKFLSSNFNHGNNVYHINLEQKQKICLFYFWAFSFFQTYISEFIDCYNIIRTRKTKQKKEDEYLHLAEFSFFSICFCYYFSLSFYAHSNVHLLFFLWNIHLYVDVIEDDLIKQKNILVII